MADHWRSSRRQSPIGGSVGATAGSLRAAERDSNSIPLIESLVGSFVFGAVIIGALVLLFIET